MKPKTIKIKGKVIFDPPNVTEKHRKQGEWKKVAILSIGSDLEKYYGWFIKKRFNIGLATTLRGPHVTFINDKESETNGKWESVKNKWDGKKVYIELEISPRTDGDYWWLRVYPESRKPLQDIRNELGLGLPYFGMHMTIGSPVNMYHQGDSLDFNGQKIKRMNIEQSHYIHNLIKNGIIE